MTDQLFDPFDRDHGPRQPASAWTIAALVCLILLAMVVDIARSMAGALVRGVRGEAAVTAIESQAVPSV